MTDFVLVHGGWHGGWCWDAVAEILRGKGHRVFAPTMTGLCERAHLIEVVDGPDMHVSDVCGVMEWEDLRDVVLVGHSYGGLIVTGVASRMPERIARLVYLDAFVPTETNQPATAFSSPERAAEISAMRRPDGHMDPSGFHRWVAPERIDWVKARTTAQPGGCFNKGVTLDGRENEVARKDYIICGRHKPSHFWQFFERYDGVEGWQVHELDSLHDAMIEVPEELAAILLDAP